MPKSKPPLGRIAVLGALLHKDGWINGKQQAAQCTKCEHSVIMVQDPTASTEVNQYSV
jgi:hypothetical protein